MSDYETMDFTSPIRGIRVGRHALAAGQFIEIRNDGAKEAGEAAELAADQVERCGRPCCVDNPVLADGEEGKPLGTVE